MRSVWLGLVFVAAACGGGDDDGRSPAAPDEGGASSAGKSSSPRAGGSGKGQTGDGDGGEAVGQGGAGDAGGEQYEAAGGPPDAPTPVCDPQLNLGADEARDIGVAGITLLSLTPDELSIAFTTGTGASLVLHVADRSSTDSAFVEAGLTLPDGFEAARGAALSSDGRLLILPLLDGSGFGQLSRSKPGQAFGPDADVSPFAKLNAAKAMSGYSLGWPVLASDGQDLYFLSYFAQGLINQSRRDKDGVFDLGTEIDEFTLGGQEGEYKLINGLSVDQRAIFFFDEATQHQTALFRSRPGAPFYDPIDLGERRGAAPNADCSRIYSSVMGSLVTQQLK